MTLYERPDTGEVARDVPRTPKNWRQVRPWLIHEIERLERVLALRGCVDRAIRTEGMSTLDLMNERCRLARKAEGRT